MDLDTSASRLSHLYQGGNSEAKKIFRRFLKRSLPDYDANRNQPQTDYVSHMSKYLHYGHVSPIWLALEAKDAGGGENTDSFLEELIVRRELTFNFVFYNDDYDSYANLPGWAKKTLEDHKEDGRQYTYTRKQLENAETHDEYWNAAMKEMVHTGYMHNYMRMYWGKKILEWSDTPEHAYSTTLYLNNKYFSTAATPTPSPTSPGSSASTTAAGPSARSTARSATCPPVAWSARPSPRSTSRRLSVWSKRAEPRDPLKAGDCHRASFVDQFDALLLLDASGEDGVDLDADEHHEAHGVEPEHEHYDRA
jgi:hypothetical protein